MENADQDEELPGQFTKEELDRKLSEAQERLDKYKGYRKYMEENNLSQLSLSDTDTKLMKTRTGFSVAHNVQTVVESDTHAIVICPAGRQLRQNQVTRQGFIRCINKMAYRKCSHRDKCHSSKKGFKEIEFRKDEFIKPHRQWLKQDGKKSDVKSRN